MSLSSTALQAISETQQHSASQPQFTTQLLAAALALSVIAAVKSRKELRKMRRKAMWSLFKAKVRGLFGKRDTGLSTRTLIYILIGLGVVILAFLAPVGALILLLAGLVYIIATR